MKRLKTPLTKLPKGMTFQYKLDNYTFQAPTFIDLVEKVYNYICTHDKQVDINELSYVIEDSICRDNPHMPQYERKVFP